MDYSGFQISGLKSTYLGTTVYCINYKHFT